MLTRIAFEKFTAFKSLAIDLSPGINVLIGANATGKTHILKAAYAACKVAGRRREHFGEKLESCFLPFDHGIGRLVHRTKRGREGGSVDVWQQNSRIRAYISTVMKDPREARLMVDSIWADQTVECAFIPVKEMLANAPGFRSLYSERIVHFEEVYDDILESAYKPGLRRAEERASAKKLMGILEEKLDGRIEQRGETFVWKRDEGAYLEFTLLAEGLRKLGLLWLLIKNGTLWKGSVLFWDEPEANLNPALMTTIANILIELQRLGVQVLLATHSLTFIKELQLAQSTNDSVRYHSLYRDKKRDLKVDSETDYLNLDENAISNALDGLYNRLLEAPTGK